MAFQKFCVEVLIPLILFADIKDMQSSIFMFYNVAINTWPIYWFMWKEFCFVHSHMIDMELLVSVVY